MLATSVAGIPDIVTLNRSRKARIRQKTGRRGYYLRSWSRSGGPRCLVDRLVWSRGERLPLLDRSRLPSVELLWPPRCPALPPAEAFFGRPLAFFGAASSASLRALAGLLGSTSWLLVGGEAVSDPDESRIVESEAGDLSHGDLGSGEFSNEKKRELVLEFWPGEVSLGGPSVGSGRLCRGSSGGRSPGAFSAFSTDEPR